MRPYSLVEQSHRRRASHPLQPRVTQQRIDSLDPGPDAGGDGWVVPVSEIAAEYQQLVRVAGYQVLGGRSVRTG